MKKCILFTAVCLAFGTAFGTVFAGLAYLATEFNEEAYYDKRCSLPTAEQNHYDIEFCPNHNK